MVEPLTIVGGVVVALPALIMLAGFVYAKVTGFDEVESIEEAVAKAHDVREGNDD